MATATVISSARSSHRTARVHQDGYQGALALDWANGQTIHLSSSNQASAVFDADNDRIVVVSGDHVTWPAYITVGTSTEIAGTWVGVVMVPPEGHRVEVYVPKGLRIGAVQLGTHGDLYMVPALLAGG